MKQTTQLEKEIQSLESKLKEVDKKSKKEAIKQKIRYHRFLVDYLKTNPSEEFLQKEAKRLEFRLEKIIEGEPKGDTKNPFFKKELTSYRKLMDYSGTKQKLETI